NKHFLQKKYNDAIHCYNQALKQNGEKAIYYVNRALCYIKLKQWDKVYQDARHCLDLDPNYIKAHAYLGQYYIEQQRYDEAITYFKQALELCKTQNKNFGDEIQRLLRYAQKRRFSIMEHKRIENEISLQTYLRSLIQTDKERRMQLRIEKYLEDKDPTQSSTNTLSILKQFLSKITNRHNQQITTNLASVVSVSPKVATTTTHNNEMNVAIDQQLEQALQDIEQSADQSINEMNTLFNEVDVRRKRREIPEYLTCKLCYDLMRDPVITPFGITYCRSCIEENLYKVSHLDPIANKPLVVDQLVNNLVLKEIVEKFIKENEWAKIRPQKFAIQYSTRLVLQAFLPKEPVLDMLHFVLVLIAIASSFSDGVNTNQCTPLSTQKNTSTILAQIRQEMQKEDIGLYVVFADDEHGSEYTQAYDKRRDWLTGFRGSAGTAVVSLRTAALWTDSRYFTQAEEQLDCANWLLMRDRDPGVPTIIDWIVSELNQTALRPGTTAVFTSTSWWTSANSALKIIGKELRSVEDLVSRIWPSSERPKELQGQIFTHDIEYAGETVAQKLNRTTAEMKRLGATTAVISALDETAWLFNLRGTDIPFNPFFKSYAIIHADYQVNQPELFVNLAQLNVSQYPPGVRVFNNSIFWSRLNQISTNASINRIMLNTKISQAILNLIPENKLLLPLSNSPVQRIKARKNAKERKGMQDCQLRDAVARMKHLGWLEKQLDEGKSINETQSSDQLLVYQQQQDRFQFPSFRAITASGDRAAIVHYSAAPETAQLITKNKVYLLDAGSQYLDCTTDITRTHHFGVPKDLEKRAYTRVLQGVIDIAEAVFPTGTYGRSLDHLGRMSLYRDGMTFGHGVGHGIGHFLSVHEGPQRIASPYNALEETLADGVFLSDEPGFYKPGDFGIRIENDMEVVLANKSSYENRQYLRFNTITLLPYERSLIDASLLTNAQLNTINQYHAKVRDILEPLLQGDEAALHALHTRTASIDSIPTIPNLSYI
ncbi:unnamed protein product, partial [Rotaria magnacalcarata]